MMFQTLLVYSMMVQLDPVQHVSAWESNSKDLHEPMARNVIQHGICALSTPPLSWMLSWWLGLLSIVTGDELPYLQKVSEWRLSYCHLLIELVKLVRLAVRPRLHLSQ